MLIYGAHNVSTISSWIKERAWEEAIRQFFLRLQTHISRRSIQLNSRLGTHFLPTIRNAFRCPEYKCVVVLIVLFLSVFAPSTVEQVHAAGMEATQRSVPRVFVAIRDENGEVQVVLGTGFAIASDVIVTNRHVIEMAEGRDDAIVAVIGPAGEAQRQRAEIIMVGRYADLALLRVPGADFVPLTLTRERVGSDVRVRAIGYPGVVDRMVGGSAIDPSTPEATDGAISSYKSINDGAQTSDGIVHTAVVSQGSSGGPLVDECGRVIGVNTGIDVGRGSFAFAQGIDILAMMAEEAGVSLTLVTTQCSGAIEEARQRSIAEQQRQSDAALSQANEIEQLKAEVARREAERDAAALAAQQASNRFNIALGGFGMAVVAVALIVALRRRHWKTEITWASVVILLAGISAAFWWISVSPSSSGGSQRVGNTIANAGQVLTDQDPSQSGITQQSQVSDDVVGSNLGGPDEALMRDPNIGKAFNCRLDPNLSRNTAAAAAPPERIDMRLNLTTGCLMGRSQYALVDDKFIRLTLVSRTRSGIISTINPTTGQFSQRFVPISAEDYEQLNLQRKAIRSANSCNSTQSQREAELIQANQSLLSATPIADLVWICDVEK
ncbi:Trypsin-like peptidase domain containing protein [Caulobacteraceae bacterium]